MALQPGFGLVEDFDPRKILAQPRFGIGADGVFEVAEKAFFFAR